MHSLSTRGKSALVTVALLGIFTFVLLVCATEAYAAFRLEYVDGVKPTDGIATSSFTSAPQAALGQEGYPLTTGRATVTQAPAPMEGDAFWRALQRCETPNGDTHPLYVGPYQFHPDTAARAGGTDLAAAKRWAQMVVDDGGHPGSTAGWPVCWWRAKAVAGYAPY